MDKNNIRKFLSDLEQKQSVKILFAVENGSRAWQMESTDSDYDVRFVFYRPLKDYITLSAADDVINMAFDDNLAPCAPQDALYDFSGFDIFKYLQLLLKSNPTAIEWLMSDIVYTGAVPAELKHFAETRFNPAALVYHYVSLAKKSLRFMRERQIFTGKKYLYVFRGLANALYVQNHGKVPPISFPSALAACRADFGEERYALLCRLIDNKKQGREKEKIGPQPLLDEYADSYQPTVAGKNNHTEEYRILDSFLQKLLLGEQS